jgi:16S rRNA (uracil1498-N3)-methyltransferase
MQFPRFFIDTPLAVGREVPLPQNITHHAINVIKVRNGSTIVLFDGRGGEYAATIDTQAHTARIDRHDPVDRESPLELVLVQAWLSTGKVDYVVEKTVELGVAQVVMVPSVRSIIKLEGDRLRQRMDHLRAVVVAACCQCKRTRIPKVIAAESLEHGLRSAAAGGSAVMLDPKGAASVAATVGPASRVALAIGPEGGFDPRELELATQIGYRTAHLGPRILRTETAGLAAIAQLQARYGDCV